MDKKTFSSSLFQPLLSCFHRRAGLIVYIKWKTRPRWEKTWQEHKTPGNCLGFCSKSKKRKNPQVLMESLSGLAHFPLFHYLSVEGKTLVFSSVNSSSERRWGFIMEMKPSLSPSSNQMQDLHAEHHHHHHQSNLTLTRPAYEKHASRPNSTNKDVANVVLLGGGWWRGQQHVCSEVRFFITWQRWWKMPNSPGRSAERFVNCCREGKVTLWPGHQNPAAGPLLV